MQKLIQILLIVLFVSLPLVNSHLLDLFWLKISNIYVNWNFEFFKVMFFNVLSWFIILLFSIKVTIKKENIKIPKIIYPLVLILFLSTIFSISPYISLFWNNTKAHSLLMFLNLIWVFIVLINEKKDFLKKLFNIIILSSIFIIIIAIWQYFLPSFNYWELSNRALWTFWHPNYLAWYLLMIISLLLYKIEKSFSNVYIIILWLTIFTLILTKSAWAIFIMSLYLIYYFYKTSTYKYKNNIFILTWLVSLSLLIYYIINNFGYSKLYSFLSRFYIWETTLNIIFSDIKTLLIWNWFETLELIFEKNKSIYLYIYENIWFTADRPHNLLINILYHTGISWLIIIWLWIFHLVKNYLLSIKTNINTYFYEALILGLIFSIFNFLSIVSYLLIILLIVKILKNTTLNKTNNNIIITLIFIIWFTSIIYSSKYYIAETYVHRNNIIKAIKIHPYNQEYYYTIWDYQEGLNIWKIKQENYFYSKINSDKKNIETNCSELIYYFSSVENYFYCWKYFEKLSKYELSNIYYKKWLEKLPDLRNNNSKYYDNLLLNKKEIKHRFLSEKYSSISKIINKLKD